MDLPDTKRVLTLLFQPFQVTVSIPVEYTEYMTPVLRAEPVEDEDSEYLDGNSVEDSNIDCDEDSVFTGMDLVSLVFLYLLI